MKKLIPSLLIGLLCLASEASEIDSDRALQRLYEASRKAALPADIHDQLKAGAIAVQVKLDKAKADEAAAKKAKKKEDVTPKHPSETKYPENPDSSKPEEKK